MGQAYQGTGVGRGIAVQKTPRELSRSGPHRGVAITSEHSGSARLHPGVLGNPGPLGKISGDHLADFRGHADFDLRALGSEPLRGFRQREYRRDLGIQLAEDGGRGACRRRPRPLDRRLVLGSPASMTLGTSGRIASGLAGPDTPSLAKSADAKPLRAALPTLRLFDMLPSVSSRPPACADALPKVHRMRSIAKSSAFATAAAVPNTPQVEPRRY